MIKFFRKIRQNLLSEGKTGKYFKYAIGEIILVVIGILIALSINNWNESRKTKENVESIFSLFEPELRINIIKATHSIRKAEFVDSIADFLMSDQLSKDYLVKNPDVLSIFYEFRKSDFQHENLDDLISLEKQFPNRYKDIGEHIKYLKRSIESQHYAENRAMNLSNERYKELIDTEEWFYNEKESLDKMSDFINSDLFKNKVKHYLFLQHENIRNISITRNASIGLLVYLHKKKSDNPSEIKMLLENLRLRPIPENVCNNSSYKVLKTGFQRNFLIYNYTNETVGINILSKYGKERKPLHINRIPPKNLYFGSYQLRNDELIEIVKNEECYKVYNQYKEDYILIE